MKAVVLYAILALVAAYFVWLSIPVDIAKKYSCKYAVITGANGGLGREETKRLVQTMNVIVIGRRLEELQKMAEEHKNAPFKVIPFVFDLNGDLLEFGPKFDEFLKEQKISKDDIGYCHSNAGHGQLGSFNKLPSSKKLAFMKINLDQHVMVADYFMKLFEERKGKKSAMVFTASLASYMPLPSFVLYHTTKSAISSLANGLYAEYRFKGIDVLAVHPTVIRNTNFYKTEEMKTKHKQLLDYMEEYKISSTTPKQVVHQIVSRLGKVCCTRVGWTSVVSALLYCMGRNTFGRILSHFNLGQAAE